MKSYLIPGTKLLIQLTLFVVFFVHFGIPSLKKYRREETIIVHSEEVTQGFEAPVVTISARQGSQETFFFLCPKFSLFILIFLPGNWLEISSRKIHLEQL